MVVHDICIALRIKTRALHALWVLCCAAGCSVELQANSGTLESPGFPWSRLPRAVTCQWRVVSPVNRPFTLSFEEFNLTDATDHVNVSGHLRFLVELSFESRK